MLTTEGKKQHTLSQLTEKIHELPMLPTVVAQLMALPSNDERFYEKILELAESDPPLSTRLLQLANSASQYPASAVTTIHNAITRIGTHNIMGIILSMAVLKVFVPSTQGQRNLWVHAIQVAITSRAIATLAPSLQVDPEQAYLCGLMHDIGRFVLFDGATEELARVDEMGWRTPQQLIEVENNLYGFNHAELGWHACKKWKLPKLIELCVKEHHNYSLHTSNPKLKSLEYLIRIIQMADFFSVLIILQPEILALSPKKMEQEIAKHCILRQWSSPPCTAKQLQSVAIKINEESNAVLANLGIRQS